MEEYSINIAYNEDTKIDYSAYLSKRTLSSGFLTDTFEKIPEEILALIKGTDSADPNEKIRIHSDPRPFTDIYNISRRIGNQALEEIMVELEQLAPEKFFLSESSQQNQNTL